MKISINGNRMYVDSYILGHVEVPGGHSNQSFSGEAEPRYSHAAGRELLHVDGLGWVGACPECAIRLGRVVRGDGSVLPCLLTEARLIGMANFAAEQGKRITLEIERG